MEDFLTIVHPISKNRISIFSSPGRNLLKSYLQTYKSGGALEMLDHNRCKVNDKIGVFNYDSGKCVINDEMRKRTVYDSEGTREFKYVSGDFNERKKRICNATGHSWSEEESKCLDGGSRVAPPPKPGKSKEKTELLLEESKNILEKRKKRDEYCKNNFDRDLSCQLDHLINYVKNVNNWEGIIKENDKITGVNEREFKLTLNDAKGEDFKNIFKRVYNHVKGYNDINYNFKFIELLTYLLGLKLKVRGEFVHYMVRRPAKEEYQNELGFKFEDIRHNLGLGGDSLEKLQKDWNNIFGEASIQVFKMSNKMNALGWV